MNAVPVAELWVSVSADVNGAIAGLEALKSRLASPKVSIGDSVVIHNRPEAEAFLRERLRAIPFKRYSPYAACRECLTDD